MKFLLLISICSFIDGTCLEPIKYPKYFDDWKTCTISALEISKDMLMEQDKDLVNNYYLATQFSCQPLTES
tara:strand:+ start:386 stop:598 length:213 start_codon:yes stop_codon:yes gene_type:complete